MYLKSKIGEVKHISEWEKEVDEFWRWAVKQNRYMPRKEFSRPVDAFSRYAKLLGLEVTSQSDVFYSKPSYEGVF